jgi:hypothetical protein
LLGGGKVIDTITFDEAKGTGALRQMALQPGTYQITM